MTRRIRILKTDRMTSQIQKRLEAFGFKILWVRISASQAVIGYI